MHEQWYKNEITTAYAVKRLGVSRNTFYRRMWDLRGFRRDSETALREEGERAMKKEQCEAR